MASFSRRALFILLATVLFAGSGCREVSQPALDRSGPLFPVRQNGEWGYVTRDGSLAIAPQFERAYRFVDNRALVRQNGRYGFIDPSGTTVISPTFAGAWHFSEGVAPVRPDSLWGFIDRTGSMVIAPQFDLIPTAAASLPPTTDRAVTHDSTARSRKVPVYAPLAPSLPTYFSEGLARIRTEGRWGYINRQGTPVISPRFAWAWDFRNGLARVQLDDGRMGYIRPDGSLVWPSSQE